MTDTAFLSDLALRYENVTRQLIALEELGTAYSALTSLAVQIPGAQQASMTRLRSGRFETIASTGELPVRADAIQYALGSGPCVDAVLDSQTFRTGDLPNDPRWPVFGRRAFEETGTQSMLSLRLQLDENSGDQIVGLNIYSTEPDAFDDRAEMSAVLLATHGSLAVAGTRAREQVANLEIAVGTRTEIGVAMGILMSRHKVTRDDAFNLLRIASQSTGRRLAAVAADVADTGDLAGMKSSTGH